MWFAQVVLSYLSMMTNLKLTQILQQGHLKSCNCVNVSLRLSLVGGTTTMRGDQLVLCILAHGSLGILP